MTDPCSIFTHGYFVDDVLTRDETLAVFEWGWFDSLVTIPFKKIRFTVSAATKIVTTVSAATKIRLESQAATQLVNEVLVATNLLRSVEAATVVIRDVEA